VLSDANDRIHAQDAKIADLRADAEPVLRAVRPLVRETRPLVRDARALRRPLTRTLEDLAAAAQEAPPALRAARVLVGRSLPVIESLQAVLPELRAVLPRAARFLDETERRALLRRADEAVSATLHLESLQIRALRLQERQFDVQDETLAIQRRALRHIRSIDRRTGGGAPLVP
jgi:ABC-type transporter Mla subunit MlaD